MKKSIYLITMGGKKVFIRFLNPASEAFKSYLSIYPYLMVVGVSILFWGHAHFKILM
jgi:hypothetical protein